MWADNETLDDLVGFRVHAELIREVIVDPAVLPVTIGVFGDWGSGKSSVMKMLKEQLETYAKSGGLDDKRYEGIAVLYFNGWLFEGYDDAKSAILTSVLTALRDHERFGPKIKNAANRLLRKVSLMRGARVLFSGIVTGAVAAATTGGVMLPAALASAGAVASDAAKATVTEPSGDEANADAGTSFVTDVRGFRDEFERMLSESDITTLVVLVDDLDRCSAERIIDNLEAIKLFLNVPRTAFVIGADRRIVRHAVAYRYRDAFNERPAGEPGDILSQADRLVTDYLEKLIQITYRLPRLSPAEIETYLTLLFCRRDLADPLFQKCLSRSRALRSDDRYRTFGYKDVEEALRPGTVPAQLRDSLRIGSAIAGYITDVLQGNPRQVKRFLNTFFLRRRLAKVAGLREVREDVLVKLMLLEYKEERLFRSVLESIDSTTGHSAVLAQAEAGKFEGLEHSQLWASNAYKNWLQLDPKLGDEDLRDYLWVTRDRLESTLSGITMIGSKVRQILAGTQGGALPQKAALAEIKKLNPEEKSQLWNQARAFILRTPKEFKYFKVLFELLDHGSGSSGELDELIRRIDAKELPPALGAHMELVFRSKPELKTALAPAVAHLGALGSKAGSAFRQG